MYRFHKDRIKDQGLRIMDHGSSIKDPGSWIKDPGACFGMNNHPGRNTDVISRLSKSAIKDLSFYIGFTRIGSRVNDLGPCFGMNLDLGPCFGMRGHPRRDTDVILRLSKSTTDFLSFYIGFGSLSRGKMVALDEIIDINSS